MKKITEHYKKAHPFAIIKKFKISVLLILLSILQQFLYRPKNLPEIIGSLGLSAVYAIGIVVYAVSSYTCYSYRIIENGIQIRDGVFIKKRFTVPYSKIQTVAFHRDIIALLFGAVRVSFDTPGGLSKYYDVSVYFSKKNAQTFLLRVENHNPKQSVYRANIVNTLLMCAFWSNPASGLLFLAPLVSQLGDIAGKEIADKLLHGSLDFRLRLIALNIPPATAGVASVLLVGWAVSMLVEFLRYARFKTYIQGDYLAVRRGLINKRLFFTRFDGLAAVTVDQSLLMHFMGLYTAGIFTIGLGKSKDDKSLIIAPEHKSTFRKTLKNLLKVSQREIMSVYTAPKTLPSYLYFPFFVTVLTVGIITSADYFTVVNDLFKALLLFLLVPLGWWLIFRIFAHKHAHLGIGSKHLIVCGFDKFTLKTYYIPFDKVQCVQITQSIPQRMSGTCNVNVYLYFEKRAFHTVKHLPKKDIEELLSYIQQK